MTSNISTSSGLVVDEETVVVNWAVVALAILCIFITAVAVAVMGWRYKRLVDEAITQISLLRVLFVSEVCRREGVND